MPDISKAVEFLKRGDLVVFPTETVYGIGADARSDKACQKIYASKGRPSHNPLIVHVASVEQAQGIAIFNKWAEKLAQIWPGPLTMVLPLQKNHNIAKCVTAGLSTIAVRIPAHPLAIELIRASGCPIAAPSANLSGQLSSTGLEQVKQYFDDRADIFILESSEECAVGLESTIIDLTTDFPVILRQGFFTKEILSEYLSIDVKIADENSPVIAPGMLLKHYAPKTKVRLNAIAINERELALNFADSYLSSQYSLNLSKSGDLIEAASNLYYYLHKLDIYAQKNGFETIAVVHIPNEGIGAAINDRLKKASNG